MASLVDVEAGVGDAGGDVLGVGRRGDAVVAAGRDDRRAGDAGQAVPHVVAPAGLQLLPLPDELTRGLGHRHRAVAFVDEGPVPGLGREPFVVEALVEDA